MKAPALWFALVLATGSSLTAAVVERGASREEVRAALGAPRGELKLGGRHVLYYERGEIELQQDTVTRVALRSEEEQALFSIRQERVRDERTTRRAQLMAEGTAVRNRKLADPAFLAAPVAYQVAFWEDFVRRYPEVSCVEPLTIARLRLSEQFEDKRRREEQADRLAAIEERFAAAERQPVIYPLFTSSRYSHRYHHHQPFGLGPITYTFFDKPLPPYSTPSGNPAGNLTSPTFNLPASIPALRGRANEDHPRWDKRDRSGRQPGRGFANGSHRFRGRT